MPEPSYDKAALRRRLLANRQAMAPEVRQEWDAAICKRVLAWLDANPAQTIGVYWPIREEPDLRICYAELATRGVQLALPTVVDRAAPLCFVAWTPGEVLVNDGFGVPVPAVSRPVLHPDALLVPCVGFNADNFRLGYGGGFYDRTLAPAASRPLAVGIAYRCGMACFANEPHDIALDDVITEQSPLTFAPMSL